MDLTDTMQALLKEARDHTLIKSPILLKTGKTDRQTAIEYLADLGLLQYVKNTEYRLSAQGYDVLQSLN